MTVLCAERRQPTLYAVTNSKKSQIFCIYFALPIVTMWLVFHFLSEGLTVRRGLVGLPRVREQAAWEQCVFRPELSLSF